MVNSEGEGNGRRPRLLLLDDDERFLRAMRLGLSDEAEIVGVSDPAEAIRILASDEPLDLALFDVLGCDGYAVARKARELRPDLPFAMLSGSREPEDINPAALEGFAFLAKGAGDSVAEVRRWIRWTAARETIGDRRVRIVRDFCRENTLTKRQEDVLFLRQQRKSTEDIAQALGISPSRVRTLDQDTRDRVGIADTAEIVALLERRIASA